MKGSGYGFWFFKKECFQRLLLTLWVNEEIKKGNKFNVMNT